MEDERVLKLDCVNCAQLYKLTKTSTVNFMVHKLHFNKAIQKVTKKELRF